jgi:hypothetical protein
MREEESVDTLWRGIVDRVESKIQLLDYAAMH